MIWFIAGIAIGAVMGVFVTTLVSARKPMPEENEGNMADSERLKREKQQRAEMLKEQERQFDMMMRYTGKEQKRA